MKCIRKFTPVSPYDIQGLESWLQDLALQGLYLAWFRPLFSTFVQDTPRRVRYRVEFCKEADQDGPPQDLKDLYSDFGWDYMGRAWDSTLLIFRTRDSRAEEPHTDPPLQGELLEKLARRLGRRFFRQIVLTLVMAVLCAALMGPAPVAQLVVHPQLLVFLLCLVFSLLGLPSRFRSWRSTIHLARQLGEGAPLDHQVPYPRHNRKSLAEFSAAVVLLGLLAVTWFWDMSGEYLRSTQEIEDFTPLPLGSLERGAYADVCNAHHSLLCWDQWEVCQIGDAGRVGDGIFWKRMDIHWYRPVLPALAEPVACGLLERAKWPGDDKWWTIPWSTWDEWTVTEYAVDGLDWCAVAEYPGGYFHLAALSGNGRAAVVQYTGSGNLADHLEELAGMVE